MLNRSPAADRKRKRRKRSARGHEHDRPPRSLNKPPPSSDDQARKDRERQRRCRARRKTGEKRFVISAREHWVAEAMLLSGRMKEEEVCDRALVEAALSRVIVEWIARWLK